MRASCELHVNVNVNVKADAQQMHSILMSFTRFTRFGRLCTIACVRQRQTRRAKRILLWRQSAPTASPRGLAGSSARSRPRAQWRARSRRRARRRRGVNDQPSVLVAREQRSNSARSNNIRESIRAIERSRRSRGQRLVARRGSPGEARRGEAGLTFAQSAGGRAVFEYECGPPLSRSRTRPRRTKPARASREHIAPN